MQLAINKLISLGAVTICEPTSDQYISKIFLAPKPNGDKIFILNLKSFNKFVSNSHFKMEDYRTASKLIPQYGFLATIDLREAYLLLPVCKVHRKYLRFQFTPLGSNKPTTYEFSAMPYGLSVAPRVFTKVMKEVMAYLRRQGHQSVIYLDDILCIANNVEKCTDNVNKTIRLLERLGFIINNEKSSLEPKQICKFLGLIFDTRTLSISLPPEKRNNIAQLIQKYSNLKQCTIREFSQLIGVLTAACPAVKYEWLYTKLLERHKYLALLKHNDNYEAKMHLPIIIFDDLDWWRLNIGTTSNSMRTVGYKLEIYTDASRTGWGSVCGDKRVSGRWKLDEAKHHINYLELLAAFLGLKSYAHEYTNCAILLRVDNTTAISYINRMGGIQFPHLSDLTRSIWRWCEERSITIFASYVNTKFNLADVESRKVNPDTEWELSHKAFQIITRQFGCPELDLFASRSNAKCDAYVSWKPDPDAIAVDAFTIDWQPKLFYAFPPFSLILKCLRKVIDDEASGILVFPYWPSQPWFPVLQDILDSNIIFLNPSKFLLQSHFREHHPLHANLTLGVAKLCGRRSCAAARPPPR